MFDHKHYVPILKWKRGEQKALEFLAGNIKNKLTPLIEIVPIPYDYVNECPQKSLDEHLSFIGESIQVSWASERPLFLDLLWLDDEGPTEKGLHPLAHILNDIRSRQLKIIPVTGLHRDTTYQTEVRNANKQDKMGICIRLDDNDFLTTSNIGALLTDLDVTPSNTDLIIDFKFLQPGNENTTIIAVMNVINMVPNINAFRSVTFAGSAFPEELSSIPANNIGGISRSEWIIWEKLFNNQSRLQRMPTFGDYAIANPTYSEIDPRVMRMSANIRYTSTSQWLIFRGRQVKRHGFEQFIELAKLVVNHPSYSGQNFSWGDNYIYECANQKCSSGNAETWRRVGTNHHLSFIVNQIATLCGP